jgi:hypothetical protein
MDLLDFLKCRCSKGLHQWLGRYCVKPGDAKCVYVNSLENYCETDSYLLDNHRLAKCHDRHSPICTYLYTDYTHTHIQSSYTLLLLCLSYILMPSHLNPIHSYLYRSSIPAHCKYGTGTDPAYLLYSVLFVSYFFISCGF